VHSRRGVVVGGGRIGDGTDDGHFLERAEYLVDARVRSSDESERAQHQRGAVHRHPPVEQAVTVTAVVGTGDGHVAQRREYQRQERAGHGAHHGYEQAQVWYHVSGDD